ncbi:MAG: hypothetical protein ABJP48_12525 [Erythrobacter sp.]
MGLTVLVGSQVSRPITVPSSLTDEDTNFNSWATALPDIDTRLDFEPGSPVLRAPPSIDIDVYAYRRAETIETIKTVVSAASLALDVASLVVPVAGAFRFTKYAYKAYEATQLTADSIKFATDLAPSNSIPRKDELHNALEKLSVGGLSDALNSDADNRLTGDGSLGFLFEKALTAMSKSIDAKKPRDSIIEFVKFGKALDELADELAQTDEDPAGARHLSTGSPSWIEEFRHSEEHEEFRETVAERHELEQAANREFSLGEFGLRSEFLGYHAEFEEQENEEEDDGLT